LIASRAGAGSDLPVVIKAPSIRRGTHAFGGILSDASNQILGTSTSSAYAARSRSVPRSAFWQLSAVHALPDAAAGGAPDVLRTRQVSGRRAFSSLSDSTIRVRLLRAALIIDRAAG